ncbi:MAG: type II secretion system protein [Verrucomicrobia bacterium]|nr:type II secretion system protein [Verrucomicrobiota bacterium]
MKHHPHRRHTRQRAMTLIELLVVISIIGVLAGLILPAVGNVKKKARVVQAQKDIADIKSAISIYQHDYSRLPASSSVAALGTDFTYGTTTASTGYGGGTTNIYNNNNVGYQASNAELMLILTSATSFPDYTTNNCNAGDVRNPRKIGYLNAKSSGASGATAGKGLGNDGVFRDPWGSPYIIALDLNYDNTVSNTVYRLQGVAQVATGSSVGHFGLVGSGNGNNNNYTLRDSVMIFSFGGDGSFDTGTQADTGVNKDNVLSWK